MRIWILNFRKEKNMPELNFSEVFTIKNIIIYLIVINIVTFLAMWIDKKKAKRGRYRISEQALFILVLLGGGVGGIAGMYTFRHKTQKPRFVIGFPFILIFEILAALFIIFTK